MPSKIRKLDVQSTSTQVRETNDGAVKASYIIASEMAAASKPFSDGEFIKTCMLAAAELVCPEKRQAFADINLSRDTVAERIGDLAGDLNRQLKEKVKSFIAFSIAIDQSTDATDVAELGISIRGVDASLTITEEFVELVPVTNTATANDVFSSLVEALDRLEVDWSRAVSVTTSMVGTISDVVAKLREKVQTENPEQDFWVFHTQAGLLRSLRMDNVMDVVIKTGDFIRARGSDRRQFDALLCHLYIVHDLRNASWLSRAAVLRRFFRLSVEIGQFMNEKGNPVAELDDPDWLRDLAFLVDITQHLIVLNLNTQGRNEVVTEYCDGIHAFQLKLDLWEIQLSQNNTEHFPALQFLAHRNNHDNMDRYKDIISGLKSEFQHRFQAFTRLEKEFSLFRYPFTVDAEDAPGELQMELIDIQCNSSLKYKFATLGLDSFYQCLGPMSPKMTVFASKILCMIGTTYLCAQAFSAMNTNKCKLRNQLTDELNHIVKITTAQKLVPDVDKLVEMATRSVVCKSEDC